MSITQAEAIQLCAMIEQHAPKFGCHVALTGGTLYKMGPRKDVDILFYRIRQVDKIDYVGLFRMLWGEFGIIVINPCGWVIKAHMANPSVDIDFFFPEDKDAPGYDGDYGHV
jgi:hypothetical protein